jgi:hypothetical protein
MNISQARSFIKEELERIKKHEVELHQGCVACYVISSLKEKQGHSEQDSADLLSDTLTHDPTLNQEFIDMVEQIRMKERNLGGVFAVRERESKDSYLEAYFSNVLDELSSDLQFLSHPAILRKLLLSYLSVYLAQTMVGLSCRNRRTVLSFTKR